jgi:hypothetical protein
MLFAGKFRRLGENKLMPKRQFAATLEIDTLMYGKIGCAERPVKRKHIAVRVHL